MKLPELFVQRNVAWSFFSLKHDNFKNYFEDSNGKMLKNSFTFPKPCHEDERMKCLLSAIKHHYKLHESNALAKIDTVESTTQTDSYGQFSGGGDLCLNANLETLVFNRLTEEDADSPIYQGTSASTTMSIEGKKDTFFL